MPRKNKLLFPPWRKSLKWPVSDWGLSTTWWPIGHSAVSVASFSRRLVGSSLMHIVRCTTWTAGHLEAVLYCSPLRMAEKQLWCCSCSSLDIVQAPWRRTICHQVWQWTPQFICCRKQRWVTGSKERPSALRAPPCSVWLCLQAQDWILTEGVWNATIFWWNTCY